MKYHKIENRKLLLNYAKPSNKIVYNNQYKNKYNLNINCLNVKNNLNKIKNNYTPIKTYNYLKEYKKNDINKTTPIKYQYRKIPFEKVKGFKFKLPTNIINIKQLQKKSNINYPLIYEYNNNTIQSNMNNTNTIKETINTLNTKYETKSSLGSKYETREESANFVRSKSSLNNVDLIKNEKKNIIKNFSFIKFNKKEKNIDLSPNKKLIKYINKAIKQLNKIKIIISTKEKTELNLNLIKPKENSPNKNIKINISKIGKNLEKYKNIIDIDNHKINLTFTKNNQTITTDNNNYYLNIKKNKNIFKRLNRTITYDDLKHNFKKGNKKFNINKKEYLNKFNTINNDDNYKIKNSDTEIKIPKIDMEYIKKMKIKNEEMNKKIKLKERYKTDNDGESNYNEGNINTDIANFEFSD